MKRLKVLAGGAAFVIASAVGLAAVPAGATTTECHEGMFPVSESSTSNLRVACVVSGADGGSAVNITDFTNTVWHDGASRYVTATVSSGSTTATVGGTAATSVINIPGTFSGGGSTGDENRVVEAGFNKGLQPGTFITAESGTGPGGTITLSQPANKGATLKFMIENGPGRGVKDATYGVSSTALSSPTANFIGGGGISSDVGKSISGTGIPAGDTIASVTDSSHVVLLHATDPTSAEFTGFAGNGTISIADTTRNSTHRLVMDLAVQANHVYSASANFQTTDIGLPVKGTGLPTNAYILSVESSTNATLSASATAAAANIVTIIGNASATAPIKDGVDPAGTIQTELQLSPGLVAGSPACGDNIVTGTNLTGLWNSPAKFKSKRLATDAIFFFNDTHVGIATPQERAQGPLWGTNPLIGQLDFRTSVVNFAAYVSETPAGSAVISFPFVPTGLGQCPGTSISSTWAFDGAILSQNVAPSGYGKPGSGNFRVSDALNFAGTTNTGTASYENLNADTNCISGSVSGPAGCPTAGLSTNASTDTFTKTAHGLNDGDVVHVACTPDCTNDGLSSTIPYYVKSATANTFQLTLKPWLPGGVSPVVVNAGAAVDIKTTKVDSTMHIYYNVFDTSYSQPTPDSCSITRSMPMTDFAGAFPCQAG